MAGHRDRIHAKIVRLASSLGQDARELRFDQEIPSSGYLDSAAIMELVLWLEAEFDLMIPQEDLTLANLGTVDAMVVYIGKGQ
jgi:acyl carrier protein